jgi:hypothetical protein
VQLSAVKVPSQVRPGESFVVEILVDSNHDDEGALELFRGPEKILDQPLKVRKGENRVRLPQTLAQGRRVTYKALVRGFRDKLVDNNLAYGTVSSAGKPAVLLIEDDPGKSARKYLAPALEKADIQVDVRPPQALPTAADELQNYGKRPVKASLQGRAESRPGPGERQTPEAVRATDHVRGGPGRVVAPGPAPCHLPRTHAPDAGRASLRRLCLTS